MALKYLFAAEYKDGSVFHQNAEDVSGIDPKRSAFYDVQQDNLVTFSLIGDGKIHSVNLEDGGFEINGNKFFLHLDDELNNEKKELIFFRRHKHDFNIDMQEIGHTVSYIIGWTAAGKTYKIEFY
jgi:hypothetical protein